MRCSIPIGKRGPVHSCQLYLRDDTILRNRGYWKTGRVVVHSCSVPSS